MCSHGPYGSLNIAPGTHTFLCSRTHRCADGTLDVAPRVSQGEVLLLEGKRVMTGAAAEMPKHITPPSGQALYIRA